MSCVKYVCYGACRVSWGLCVGVIGSFFFLWVVCVCGLGVPVSGLGADVWLRKWWTGACVKSRLYIPWFSSWRYGVVLMVVCLVCGLLRYWLCFVACRGWVIEGHLKKKVRFIGHCSRISLPAWWRDCTWNCSKGSNMFSFWTHHDWHHHQLLIESPYGTKNGRLQILHWKNVKTPS